LRSSTSSVSSNRTGSHTGRDARRYHRLASAPQRATRAIGSTVFPRLFDIFLPFASSTMSFDTTAR
jgi:hypothetical protein